MGDMTMDEYSDGERQAMKHCLGFCTIDLLDPPLPLETHALVHRKLDEKMGVVKIVDSMRIDGVHNQTFVTAFRGIYEGKGIDVSKLVKSWTDENLPPVCIIQTPEYTRLWVAGGQHRANAAQIYAAELNYRLKTLNERIEKKVGVSRMDPELRELVRERVECTKNLKKLRNWLIVWFDWGK